MNKQHDASNSFSTSEHTVYERGYILGTDIIDSISIETTEGNFIWYDDNPVRHASFLETRSNIISGCFVEGVSVIVTHYPEPLMECNDERVACIALLRN